MFLAITKPIGLILSFLSLIFFKALVILTIFAVLLSITKKYPSSETEKIKFRVGVRKRYIQKTFSTSVQTVTGSYIAEGSGSYSILDIATGETVVPVSPYTSLSCDSTSNYFIQWLNGFYPN